MNEVCPAMYSPAERPSSIRAAPAKNRIWSTIGGISSDMRQRDRLAGVLALSLHQLVSMGLDGVRDAEQGEAALAGVESRQPGNASAAEAKAAATSVSLDTGALAKTSPVLGSISSDRRSNAVSVH